MGIKNLLTKLKKKLSFPLYTKNHKQNLFNIWLENPLSTWWKAKKYFKRPKIHCRFFLVDKFKNYPYATWKRIAKILDVWISDVAWKDKWNTPRHERSPLVWVCLFRKFGFSIRFNIYYEDEFGDKYKGDMEYWEYLLTWLYYRNKKTLRCYSGWVRDSQLYRCRTYGKAEDGSEDTFKPYPYIIPCVAMSLTPKGRAELKRELKEDKKNDAI